MRSKKMFLITEICNVFRNVQMFLIVFLISFFKNIFKTNTQQTKKVRARVRLIKILIIINLFLFASRACQQRSRPRCCRRRRHDPHLIVRPPALCDLVGVAGSPSVGTLKSDLFGIKPGFGTFESAGEPNMRFNQPGSAGSILPAVVAVAPVAFDS